MKKQLSLGKAVKAESNYNTLFWAYFDEKDKTYMCKIITIHSNHGLSKQNGPHYS